MKLLQGILGLLFIVLTGCVEPPITNPFAGRTVQGLRPIYAVVDNDHYYSKEPESIVALENIVVYKDYILVVEARAGIHVISNADPTNPVAIAFWVLPGVTNFTVADDVLFMPLGNDILAINIIDIYEIDIISITEDAIKSFTTNRAPAVDGPFECVHPDSGTVTAWYLDELVDPNCWK